MKCLDFYSELKLYHCIETSQSENILYTANKSVNNPQQYIAINDNECFTAD